MLKPKIKFMNFNTEDIITTSGGLIPFDSNEESTPKTNSPAENRNYDGFFTNQ